MNYTETVEKAKIYIEAHLSDELTAEKIAYEQGYSLFHFCRVFKEATGQSLMRYVREKRLEKAKADLLKGFTATDAAINCGFETESGFSRAYKRTFGQRPSAKLNA